MIFVLFSRMRLFSVSTINFVLAIFAIESNFSDLLSAKALETSLCRMWGSGHYNIGSAIFASKLLFVRLTGSLALNYAQFFG